MIVVEVLLFLLALGAVLALTVYQVVTQIKEIDFYRKNGGNYDLDSGLDKFEAKMTLFSFLLPNRERLFIFRPAYIVALVFLMIAMIASVL